MVARPKVCTLVDEVDSSGMSRIDIVSDSLIAKEAEERLEMSSLGIVFVLGFTQIRRRCDFD